MVSSTQDDPRYQEAIKRFHEWFDEARAHDGIIEPTAMTLATVDNTGRPTARTVLLKAVDERGFTFYSNRNSRKGQALTENPVAALLFHWAALHRQVKIEGAVTSVAADEADAYWASRPRESQIGAWASAQSQPLAQREDYEARAAQLRHDYADRDIPRPPYWIGFRVVPDRIEFWQEREFRQHHRECYYRGTDDKVWDWTLLNP